jgi:GT2 family glycosyltransferase
LTIVIVNYKSWPDVARLVSAMAEAPEVADGRCEVVIVDNASAEPVPLELAEPRPGVRLVLRDENGGFAAGVNAGWRVSRSRWLLLVNPDVVAGADLPGRVLDRVGRLERRGDGAPGVVGFGLRNADGSRQPSVGAEPSLWRSVREPFIPRSRRKYQAAWRTRPGPVPWVTGACALVDGELLRNLGGMDEDFFLYYEEVALCRSARDAGRAVEYDPSVEVVHLRPLQNRPLTSRMRVITRHSKLLYFRKHLPPWQFKGLSWIVRAEAMIRGRLARRDEAARAWRAIGGLARAMSRGESIRGREILAWAGPAEESAHGPARPKAMGRRPATERVS